MSIVWSCGGGTQSAAIAALIVLGELPKPDAAVIADTGREGSATWRYFDSVLKPELDRVGVNLIRLPHSFDGTGWNTVDIFGGKEGTTALPPMYTKNGEGQTSKYCSNEWKARPVERYYRSLGLAGGTIWIGFSVDELYRMRGFDPRAKWNHEYPLIDRRITRGGCIALVKLAGWPSPPRSACWMCPYRSDAEWLDIKENDPLDWRAALTFEAEVQAVDANLYLHRSGVPLAEANLNAGQTDLFVEQCASGQCFT